MALEIKPGFTWKVSVGVLTNRKYELNTVLFPGISML